MVARYKCTCKCNSAYACVHSVVNNQNSVGAYVITPIKIINK